MPTGISASITTPPNKDCSVAVGGSLQCRVNVGIVWWYDPDSNVIFDGFTVINTRFQVSTTSSPYDLTATSVSLTDCGMYTCDDRIQPATASVLVLGKNL